MRTLKLASVTVVLLLLCVASSASAFEFKPYGFIKTDLSVDLGHPAGGGNWVKWVNPKPKDYERPTTLNLHARQSRLGFDMIGNKIKDVSVMGRIETDFTNGGAEYTYMVKLRKAYLKLSTPTMSLLAGQESDIISPLVPSTVNYLVAWWAGDIGFRRPQIRYSYSHGMGESSGLDVTLGITRSMSSTIEGSENYDVPMPTFAGRIGYRSKAFSLGFSGHYGQERERFGTDTGSVDEVFDSYSANVDLKLSLGEALTLTGEFWWGVNLDTYLGAVGQGVVQYTTDAGQLDARAVQAMGGWAQIGYVANPRMKLHLGGTVDMPNEDDLNYGGRSRNMSGFFNVHYMMAKDLWVAMEGSYFRTDYKEEPKADSVDADDIRAQLAFIYNF